MNRNTIEKILNFLKTNEDKELPRSWFDSIEKLKLIERLENHIGGIQFKHVGDLDLEGSNIRKLPKYLYVTGYLTLYNCKQITELPDNLYVGGSLFLNGCQELTKLPDNLYVGYHLYLKDCNQITELPNNLYVGGELYLYDTPLGDKYSYEEIRKIVASTGGKIIKKIYRQ